MSTVQYTASQQQMLRMFSFGFGSAISNDLISLGAGLLDQGMSAGDLCDRFLGLAPVRAAFPGYETTSNTEFVRSALTIAAHGSGVSAGVIDGWATALAPYLGIEGLETRGRFMTVLSNLVYSNAGTTGGDANLTAMGNVMYNRLLLSADYAQTAGGQTYTGFQPLMDQVAAVTPTTVSGVTLITRATSGVQSLAGLDGSNDVFVAVGVTAAGEYAGSDSNFTDLSTLNSKAASELNSGDVFDGKGGSNVLHVYGTADLTGVTLTNIQRVVLHSDVTFTDTQIAALNAAGAAIAGDSASIMRLTGTSGSTVNMSNVQLQAIGQFDLAQSLTVQISQLGLDQIGTVAARPDAFLQAAPGAPDLDFSGTNVYGAGSVRNANGITVGTLESMSTGAGTHFNTVVTSVAAMVDQMNQPFSQGGLSGVPGYITQDTVNLDVASMSLYLGSQTAADVVMAGSSAAFMRGGPGADTLIGGSSTNFMSGAGGNDTLTGGAVRDFFAGDEGNDTANGLAGNDFINTQAGDDTVNGGAGLDFIMPGDGADTVILDSDPDFISLYASTGASTTDHAIDTVKFMTAAALGGGGSSTVVVGFEAGTDLLKFESTASGSGIAGISAAAGNAVINAGAINSFSMNTAAPGGLLILTDSSFNRGDDASANSAVFGYDAILTLAGKQAGAGVAHLIAVSDGAGNTNVFYDSDGSSTANNWQLVVKLVGVTTGNLDAGSLQLINEA